MNLLNRHNLKENAPITRFLVIAVICLLLLALEFVLFTLRFDTASETINSMPYDLYGALWYAGKFLRIVIASLGALAIFGIPRIKSVRLLIDKSTNNPHYLRNLIVHFLFIVLFYSLSWLLLVAIPSGQQATNLGVYLYGLLWLLTGIISMLSLLLVIANHDFWRQLLKSEVSTLLAAGVAGILAQGIGYLVSTVWETLSTWTFVCAKLLLSVLYQNTISDLSNFELGVNDFSVSISPQCSGYEGMGLITAFLVAYLYLFRKQLRFPHVFSLFPASIVAIWLLNVVRIVVLIIIGDKLSPEIAISGFHSSAGWIIFVCLSVAIIIFSQKIDFFNKEDVQTTASLPATVAVDKALALIVPFVILLASILLATAFSAGFDWLYPLKVIACSLALWHYRQIYRRYKFELNPFAILIGIIVFGVWLVLVPTSAEVDGKFANSLFLQDSFVIYGWVFFRLVGASITVPIVEELAFRGYILTKLINKDVTLVVDGSFTWLSFLVSSVLFGLLHGDWLAGILAGMAFAYALYRRGQLFDAVLAHSVTNLLLSFYILYTGHWSLW